MTAPVLGLRSAGRERDELVSHVDERHPRPAATQVELEELPVPPQRLVDVADLERDVIDPYEPSHPRPEVTRS